MDASIDKLVIPVVRVKDKRINSWNDAAEELMAHRDRLEEVLSRKEERAIFEGWEMVKVNETEADGHNGQLYFFFPITYSDVHALRREMDSVLESAYDGIYITDTNGLTLSVNSAVERITKIPKHYFIGKNVTELKDRGILSRPVTFRVVEEKRPVTVHERGRGNREIMMTGSPVMNQNGEVEKVITIIRDMSDLRRISDEMREVRELNTLYRAELERVRQGEKKGMVCKNEAMQSIYETGARLARVDASILILGETGVGKDVFASFVHQESPRNDTGSFIKVNCGAIPETLLESELFGYEAGAFSGANKNGKAGMFELADGGTLFLDEIGEMPLDLQVKLLQVLQDKQLRRVGSEQTKAIDVRVICATNQDLQALVREGRFREDLYYRIHVIPIRIPPIRERKDEIFALAQLFLDRFNEKYDVAKQLSSEVLDFFYKHDWRGNVRELSNVVERLVVTTHDSFVTIDDLPDDLIAGMKKRHLPATLEEARDGAERELLVAASMETQNTYRLAERLGTSQATVVRKLQKYNIQFKNESIMQE
ncbi:sigma-54 interaction domain-containing protein [Geomicrobium sp. JSM 1781026]|uniref:sigma-54 interaction domain-containing protein n=1 Tax=Geomicrobium sp. JSM 1781026 TaxID=3344580 RepID=UPI0035C08764